MAIATTFTFAYYLRVLAFHSYSLYFTIIGFICLKSTEEVDISIELNDMVTAEPYLMETGPIGVRVTAILVDMIFIRE